MITSNKYQASEYKLHKISEIRHFPNQHVTDPAKRITQKL